MKILLAAESVGDVCLLQEALRTDGHEVQSARNGAAVLDALHGAHPPPLVVLDARLADQAGAEVCRRARTLIADERPVLVVLASKGGTQEAIEALDAGADLFIPRPLDADELIARVRAIARVAAHQLRLIDQIRTLAPQPAFGGSEIVAASGGEKRVVVPSGGSHAAAGPSIEQIMTTLCPLAELETLVAQTLNDMMLGDPTPAPEAADRFKPSIGMVHFMVMPDKSCWLDLLLETDQASALALYQTFTGSTDANVPAQDLIDVIGETLNMIQGTLKATFKGRGTELLVPIVPQSIPPEKIAGRVAHSTIHSSHIYSLPGILLRFTLYAYFAPVQRKPLGELGLASVLAEPLRPLDNKELVLINKGTLLNARALKKVANLAEFAPKNALHPVIAPSPLVELLAQP